MRFLLRSSYLAAGHRATTAASIKRGAFWHSSQSRGCVLPQIIRYHNALAAYFTMDHAGQYGDAWEELCSSVTPFAADSDVAAATDAKPFIDLELLESALLLPPHPIQAGNRVEHFNLDETMSGLASLLVSEQLGLPQVGMP